MPEITMVINNNLYISPTLLTITVHAQCTRTRTHRF